MAEPYSPSLSPNSSPASSNSSLELEHEDGQDFTTNSPMIDDSSGLLTFEGTPIDTVSCQWEGCIRIFASLKTLIEHLHTGA
jgi:hypothetical protein